MNQGRILVVDDEKDILDLYNKTLTEEGYTVAIAENSNEALKIISDRFFDIIIADIRMPGMDGIVLLETVKQLRPETDVIIITGYPATETAIKALKYGAFDYIIKPFTVEELIMTAKRCFERRFMSAEISALKSISALYEVSKAIAKDVDLENFLQLVLSNAIEVTSADSGSLMLIDEGGNLKIKAAKGLEKDIFLSTSVKIGEKIAGYVANSGEPLLLIGRFEDDTRFKDIRRREDIRSSLSIPLKIKNEVIGVINLNKIVSGINFTESDKELITIFAEQAASVIRDAQLHSKLQEKLAELQSAYEKLKLAQESLIRSEKLSAVGQLAAGIAHEINNPLTTILGYVQVLELDISKDDKKFRYLKIMEEEISRVSKIVRGLLDFARQKEPELKLLDINEVIEDTLVITEHQLSRFQDIKLEKFLSSNLPKVLGDKAQLQQVFINLIINAAQAMYKGGTLTIRTRDLQIQSSKKVTYQILIDFTDTGVGIPKEIHSKIFDPFFTTKEVGKGTGLGLSLAYGIIEKHGGDIALESPVFVSEDGKEYGTTFTVILSAETEHESV